MNKATFHIFVAWLIFVGCQSDQTASIKNREWEMVQSDIVPMNFYGVEVDIQLGTKVNFRDNQLVEISLPEKGLASSIDYRMVKDTLISYFDNNYELKRELTNIIYLGKGDDLMFGYRIKKLTADSLILISKYRKEQLELPKPNEFGTKPDLFNDYQMILINKK